jgi:hypothetical protein
LGSASCETEIFDPAALGGSQRNSVRGAGTRLNVFRRFRESPLQRSEARQLIIDYWMGHSSASMGDRYGKQLVEDVEYRQAQVAKVGLGFELPPSLLGLRGLQIVEGVAAA